MLLPLLPAFGKGRRLYQKPVVELCMRRAATGRRHSTLTIMDRRIRGMSDSMIVLIVIVPIIGILINGLEINGEQRSFVVPGGLGVMFIVGCVMAVRKRRGQ